MKKLNQRAFEEYVENEGKTCMVIFSRKSCHICQEVHSILRELEEDYKKQLVFYEVDVEEETSLFEKLGMKGVPQVLLFDNGRIKEKLTGRHEDEEYIDIIENNISLNF